VFVASACALTIPGSGSPVGAIVSLLQTLIAASITPALWLLASVGFGAAALKRLVPDESRSLALCAGVGIGIHLTLAHAIGASGLYSSGFRLVASWLPVVTGIVLLILQRGSIRVDRSAFGWPTLLAIPAVALLAVASAQPAGAIWASEAHAYDSLSYHLQLPKEWLAMGAVRPLAHNAYSFLPSYMESAYTQLFAMHSRALDGAMVPMFSAHILHALFAVVAGLIGARFVTDRGGNGVWVLPVVIAVPWSVVVGSLAYNEMALAVCAASALIVLFDDKIPTARRGVLLGFLMGVAASAKPTAMFTLAVPMGVASLFMVKPRAWAVFFISASIAGALTLCPWLIRNWIASGNPVFPYLTGLFGAAHWTAEQAARWAGAHTENAGIVDRLSLLAGDRGFGHRQWGIFAPLVGLAFVACVATVRTRRVALVLGTVLLVQIVAWLSVGHLQSRFLLPMLIPGVCLIALSAGVEIGRAHV